MPSTNSAPKEVAINLRTILFRSVLKLICGLNAKISILNCYPLIRVVVEASVSLLDTSFGAASCMASPIPSLCLIKRFSFGSILVVSVSRSWSQQRHSCGLNTCWPVPPVLRSATTVRHCFEYARLSGTRNCAEAGKKLRNQRNRVEAVHLPALNSVAKVKKRMHSLTHKTGWRRMHRTFSAADSSSREMHLFVRVGFLMM